MINLGNVSNDKDNATKGYVDNIYNNLQIGGRNYLLGTDTPVTLTNDGTVTEKSSTIYQYGSIAIAEFLDGKTVTISYDYTSNVTSGKCTAYLFGSYISTRYFTPSNNGSGKNVVTVTLPEATHTNASGLYLQGTFNGTVTISNAKIELGNKITDWCTAPEDIDLHVSKAINNLQIGGRNYLANSTVEKTNTAQTNNEYICYADLTSIFDKYGIGTYTFSFDAKVAVAGNMQIYCTDGATSEIKYTYPPKVFAMTTEYKRYSMTVNVTNLTPTGTKCHLSFYSTYGTGAIPFVKNVQIESGIIATSYTEAPEDIDTDISTNSIVNWCYGGNKAYINGAKLYPSTVTGSAIKSNTITASKLSAGIGLNGNMLKNPRFIDCSGSYPDGCVSYGYPPNKAIVDGMNVVEFVCDATNPYGMTLDVSYFASGLNLEGMQYFCLECKFRLTSGTNPTGATLLIDLYKTDSTKERMELPMTLAGTNLTVGNWYTIRKIFKLSDASMQKTYSGVNGYLIANFTTYTVKTIQFASINMFQATEQDYLSQTWTSNGTYIDGSKIYNGSITSNQIAPNTILLEDLASSTVTGITDTVVVGGRNLIRLKNNTVDLSKFSAYTGSMILSTLQSDGFYQVVITSAVVEFLINQTIQPITGGVTYTQSWLIKTDSTNVLSTTLTVSFFTNNGHHYITPKVTAMGTNIYLLSVTYTTSATDTYVRLCDFYKGTLNGTYIGIKNPKLELGNKATDWTPAPEDVDNSISTLSDQYNTMSNTIYNMQISGKNYALKSNIPQTLTNDSVASKILIAYYYSSSSVGDYLDGKTITISFDYNCNITSGTCGTYLYYNWNGLKDFTSTSNGSGRFSVTKTLTDVTHTDAKAFYLEGTFTGSLTINNLKIETGSSSTTWCPATEDVFYNIGGAITGSVSINTGDSSNALTIGNTSTGKGINLSNTSTGVGQYIYNNSATSGRGLQIDNATGSAANGHPSGLAIFNNTSDYTGDGYGIYIENRSSLGRGIYISNSINGGACTGLYIDSVGAGSRGIYVSGVVSTSTSTGAVVINGGLGVSDSIYCNNIIASNVSRKTSTYTTTGLSTAFNIGGLNAQFVKVIMKLPALPSGLANGVNANIFCQPNGITANYWNGKTGATGSSFLIGYFRNRYSSVNCEIYTIGTSFSMQSGSICGDVPCATFSEMFNGSNEYASDTITNLYFFSNYNFPTGTTVIVMETKIL